jgi:hypothetical protein
MSTALLLRSRSSQLPRHCVVVVLMAAAVVLLLVGLHGLDALKAAGITGAAPKQGASAFETLISTLDSNEKWLFFTGFGLAITTVALMFGFGSMRAPDYLFKLLGAVAVILIVGPALLA